MSNSNEIKVRRFFFLLSDDKVQFVECPVRI